MNSLAARIHRSEGAIRKWIRGEAEPNATDLRLICEATGASAEWLLFGRDNRLRVDEVVGMIAQLGHRLLGNTREGSSVPWSELSQIQQTAAEALARMVVYAWIASERRLHRLTHEMT